jgi:hypothetical protein
VGVLFWAAVMRPSIHAATRRGNDATVDAATPIDAGGWAIMDGKPPRSTSTINDSMFWKKRRDRKPARGNPLAQRVVRGDDRPTQPLEPGETGIRQAPPDGRRAPTSDEATRLIAPTTEHGETMSDDPPVGVLVVVSGPGKGQLRTFGYGTNSMGRDVGERVRIDFGDERISRKGHAIITYDERGRRFYLQHGGGPSLTYHGETPVLEPVDLVDGDRITLGDTQLLFRSLVGDDFDWTESQVSAPMP